MKNNYDNTNSRLNQQYSCVCTNNYYIKNKIEDLQNVSDIVDTEQAVNQLKTQYNKIDRTYMLFVNENTNEEARAALQKYMYGNEE